MNIKQFNGINSFGENPITGYKMPHDEIYSNVANAIGLESLEAYIPATKEEIQKALEADPHLNNIPLGKWDMMHVPMRQEFKKIGITTLSLSDTVCTLKQAARLWAKN